MKLSEQITVWRIGYLRYEYLRTLTPVEFADLYKRNINGEDAFDDLVDAEIKKRGKE